MGGVIGRIPGFCKVFLGIQVPKGRPALFRIGRSADNRRGCGVEAMAGRIDVTRLGLFYGVVGCRCHDVASFSISVEEKGSV
jgi:hypothetical protein